MTTDRTTRVGAVVLGVVLVSGLTGSVAPVATNAAARAARPVPVGEGWTPMPPAGPPPRTVLVTTGPDGGRVANDNEVPVSSVRISDDGRWVAFVTDLPLLAGTPADEWHVYLRDLRSGGLRRVSRAALDGFFAEGGASLSMSPSGRYLAFSTPTPQTPGVSGQQAYLYDGTTGALRRVGPATDDSEPSLGATDGRYTSYSTYDADLAPGSNPTPQVNGPHDYVYDLQTGTFSRVLDRVPGVRVGDYSGGPVADGRYVVVWADAAINRDGKGAGVFRRPSHSSRWTRLPRPPGAHPGTWPLDPAAPRYYVYVTTERLLPADRNRLDDIYRWDARTGQLTLLSVGNDGATCRSADPLGASTAGVAGAVTAGMSSDGRMLVFYSNCTQLIGVPSSHYRLFVRDLVHGTTTGVDVDPWGRFGPEGLSHGDGYTFAADVSRDGRWIAFVDSDPGLVEVGGPAGGADLYLRGPLR